MHYFIMKVPNKKELKQITFNNSSDIDFNDFTLTFLEKCSAKSYFI